MLCHAKSKNTAGGGISPSSEYGLPYSFANPFARFRNRVSRCQSGFRHDWQDAVQMSNVWVRRARAEHLCERGNYDDALAKSERIPSQVLLFRFVVVVFVVV